MKLPEVNVSLLFNSSISLGNLTVFWAASQPVIVQTLEDSMPGYAVWDASIVYLMGDKVTHLGNTYWAKWWTQGDETGTQQRGPWELIN